ncbi:unnamed protein product [Scytosiphon promiscuus]
MPYTHDVFPLQVAALIWNDGKFPDMRGSSVEDKSSLVIRLSAETLRWRPFWKSENAVLALAKLPVFLVIFCVYSTLRGLEAILYELVYRVLMWSFLGGLPLPPGVPRRYAFRLGTAALVSKVQLDMIQRKVCLDGQMFDMAQARRVFVRALHTANLLSTPQFERLMDHAPRLLNNNELASRLKNKLKERVLKSSVPGELGVLTRLTIANTYESGKQASRTAVWGRCLVGAQQAIEAGGEPSPKGFIVAAVLNVSEDIRVLAGDYNKFPCLLHWYTVTRRWFVDFTMFVWWDLSAENRFVVERAYLATLFTDFAKIDRYNRLSLGQSVSMINTAASLSPSHSKLVAKYIRGGAERPTPVVVEPPVDSRRMPKEPVSAPYDEGTVEEWRERIQREPNGNSSGGGDGGGGGVEELNWLRSAEHNVGVLQRAIMAKYNEFADGNDRAERDRGQRVRWSSVASSAISEAVQADALASPQREEIEEEAESKNEMVLRAAMRRAALSTSSAV